MLMRYETCCVDSTGELIDALTEEAEDVELRELVDACDGVREWSADKGYEHLFEDEGEGLSLEKDWHVGFHRSIYDGRPCWYIQWSGIEYIWTAAGDGEGFGHGSCRT